MKLQDVDLHVHLLQSLVVEDLFELAKDHYQEINWNRFGFLDRYEKIFGKRLDPVRMMERAIETGSLDELKEVMVYEYEQDGNFDEFDIKSFFPMCVTGFYYDNYDYYKVLQKIVDRHKKEGIKYIEYRNGFMFSYKEEWIEWHTNFARFFKEVSDDTFQAKYIIRIQDPELYPIVKEMLELNEDLQGTIVGIDFTEIAPEQVETLMEQVKHDQLTDPAHTVDVITHVGENYFDKSIESTIRWCHRWAELGAKRLAHCIVLGMDPEIQVSRQEHAHESETVEERMNQIYYDLTYKNELESYGISVDAAALSKELEALKGKELTEKIRQSYNQERLDVCRKRQDFVIDQLTKLGTIIETCPTSNLCIGGVPSIETHPFSRLYKSNVNLAICTDDPGIFDQSIKDEVEFVMNAFNLSEEELTTRLGDPYMFGLKRYK
ncbi:amidohydrolase family protein [Haloplasma contractile]|uniref:adenosine deaminase n=1 Tax=Haloplasma contractile SSD-17B TaxID=1033810 RepID=F7PRM7_9MOLU|nr:adenosine deaminase [Haloplasma contractile]ERJ11893.1 adenosine deaminase protein [Haloplasma contractile SSD-17B]